jgi:hypothetical protein
LRAISGRLNIENRLRHIHKMTYRLYVDEVGNDDLGHVHQDANRFLSLTGVAMRLDHSRDHCIPRLNALKANIFQHDPEMPIILHRTDIVGRRGPFGILANDQVRANFDAGLLRCMADLEYAVMTAVIDKRGMMQQLHWNNRHPYHYLMEILVEKYAQWLERKQATGDIMPEERKGKKDIELQRAYTSVRTWGTKFVPPQQMRRRLPASQLKFRAKADNVAALQLCDLIAHPSYIHVRDQQGHAVNVGPYAVQVVQILQATKYDRSWDGRIDGYGIKYLP